MKFVGKNNLLGSRFLEIIYFVEETSLWIRRAGLTQPALCFSFPVHKLEKKKTQLFDYVAKYLTLLYDILCRRERFVGLKNIENLHSLQHDHMVNVLSSLQLSAQISALLAAYWQPTLWHGAPSCAFMPTVPTESMSHTINHVFKGKTLCQHTFQKCPIMQNSSTVVCLIVSRCAEAFFLILFFREKKSIPCDFAQSPFSR